MTRENLLAEILDDINRTDMTSAASAAISSAISLYEAERWYFLEGESCITSSASQVYYNLPSDCLDPDSIVITVSNAKEPLERISFLEIDAKDSGNYTGIPSEYCIYGDRLRFYPLAHSTTYVFTLSYHKILTTTASASNAWTNAARNLIRHSAVKELRAAKLHDAEGALIAEQQEQRAYMRLQGLHYQKVTTGRLTKTDW